MGTSLNGLTPAGTYPGLIKTGDNAPIDGTLKTLSDGNGNNLPMAVSTTAVNFTNQLQQGGVAVPTASQVNAKQDTLVSGTNIKTVNSTTILGSGNLAVQDVLVSGTNIKTINGTSVLGAGNIVTPSPSGVSGAIQFSNGSAFASDAANLFWDDTNNRLGVGTNAPTANVHITGANQLANTFNTKIEGASGFGIFSIANDGAAQIGDYTGNGFQSSLYFLRPSGASRASRLIQGNADLTLTNAVGGFVMNGLQCTIKGSGSTSATTSLLVQNSAGSELAKVRDDGSVFYTSSYFNIQTSTVAAPIGGAQLNFNISGNGPGMTITNQNGVTYRIGQYIASNVFSIADTNASTPAFNINTANNVLINTTTNIASSKLTIESTTQGFLPPRMTTTQKNAIATPAAGLVVYDSTTNKLCCYNGSTWNDLF